MEKYAGVKTPYLFLACLVVSLLAATSVAVWGLDEKIVTRSLKSFDGRQYAEVWFPSSGGLIGVRTEASKVVLDVSRIAAESVETKSTELAAPAGLVEEDETLLFRVNEDGTAAAWAANGGLSCQQVTAGGAQPPLVTPLDGSRTPLFVFLAGQTGAGVVYGDATTAVWDCATGELLHGQQLAPENPDRVLMSGNYVAVATSEPAVARVYRVFRDRDWTVVTNKNWTQPIEDLRLSPTGRLLIRDENGLRYGEDSLASPGPLRRLSFAKGGVIYAAGDFDGVYMLNGEQHPEQVLDTTEKIRTIAATERYLAYSAAGSSWLKRFDTERGLNAKGKLGIALSILAISIIPAKFLFWVFLARLIQDLLGRIRYGKKGKHMGFSLPASLPKSIIEAAGDGDLTLFAGSGLGAQAGIVTWSQSAVRLLAWAKEWHVLTAAESEELGEAINNGNHNLVIDRIVAAVDQGRDRMKVHYRHVFSRDVLPSAVHKKLQEIPFRLAVTTSYDRVLERDGRFSHSIYTPENPRLLTAITAGLPMILKLYGDLERNTDVLLSRDEFDQAAGRNARLSEAMNHLFASRTVIFVGCSIEGLLHDLKTMQVQPPADAAHYALVGIGPDENWQAATDELNGYGVNVMTYDVGHAEVELCHFLELLADHCSESKTNDMARSAATGG